MSENLQIIFGLLGGLAIFIFGMNQMSECLQKAAGDKMKYILSLLTKNPVLGVLAGALTTAVLQSSSATTVMAIGFISAGLMNLPQAISIIIGANIGTTMTAQIIAFKISDYIYLFVFLGFLITFIFKSQRAKNIGQTIFAFGLLFVGIETMGGVMKPLASSPFFLDMIAKVKDIPVLGVGVGTLMTLVVQSSSATIGVLQNFASQAGPDGVTSILGLGGAIPILLGDNIGTTITALLASIGQNKDAKRTAVAHCIFNLSGCVLFLIILKPYTALIQYISPAGPEVGVISRQIANAHTGFNLLMTLLWIPMIAVMVKIVVLIVPDKKGTVKTPVSEPYYLDDHLLAQPVAALQLVSKELVRYGDLVGDMLKKIKLSKSKQMVNLSEEISIQEGELGILAGKINAYLIAMFSEGVMAEEQALQGANMMNLLCDMERIGQLCKEITENIFKQSKKKEKYSKAALSDIRYSIDLIEEMYSDALHSIVSEKKLSLTEMQEKKKEILHLDETLRRAHMNRVAKKKCTAKLTVAYNSILHDIDRMGNSCVNLMETIFYQ